MPQPSIRSKSTQPGRSGRPGKEPSTTISNGTVFPANNSRKPTNAEQSTVNQYLLRRANELDSQRKPDIRAVGQHDDNTYSEIAMTQFILIDGGLDIVTYDDVECNLIFIFYMRFRRQSIWVYIIASDVFVQCTHAHMHTCCTHIDNISIHRSVSSTI